MCDDENIEPIDDSDIYRYFGDYPSGAGYVLFYQAVDLDLTSLGLAPKTPSMPKDGLVNIAEAPEETQLSPDRDESSPVSYKSNLQPIPNSTISEIPKPAVQDIKPEPVPIAFIQPRRNTVVSPPPLPIVTPSENLTKPSAPVQSTATSISAPSNDNTSSSRPLSTPTDTAPSKSPTSPLPSATSPPSQPSLPQVSVSVSGNTSQNSKSKDDKWYKRKSVVGDLPSGLVSESSSHSSASQLGVGGKPAPRDRTVSNTSQSSTQDKYNGGGGLGRRLSGMSIGRSGSMSFGKLGFGKKDKNRVDE